MAYNDFIKFATNHRNLLETAIKKYPTALKPSDLVEFDQVILESKKELRKEGLLEEWMPAVTFNCPEDYLYANAEEIFLESYLGPNYYNMLTEALNLDDKTLSGIKGGLRAQITALQNIRKWYDSLTPEKQEEVEAEAQSRTKSRMDFKDELKDIEDEINGVYGKLDKSHGIISRGAKKAFGWVQRGLSRAFGGGDITDTSVQENIMFEELFQREYLQEEFGLTTAQAGQIGTAFYNLAKTSLGRGATEQAIARLMGSQRSAGLFQQAATSVLGQGSTIPMGNVNAAVHAATPFWQLPSMTGFNPSLGGVGLPVPSVPPVPGGGPGATLTPIKGAGKTIAAKAAGMGLGAKLAIGGGIAALIAAGAAGIKLRNRRKRIEILQMIARKYKAPAEVTKAVPLPEAIKTAETTTAEKPAETKAEAEAVPAENFDYQKKLLQAKGAKEGASVTYTKEEWEALKKIISKIENKRPAAAVVLKNNPVPPESITFHGDNENDKKDLDALYSAADLLERKYRLGLITLKEYNFRKNKIDMMILKEHVKRQVRSSRK